MTSLIEFDSSPMSSPIESMHFDSSLTKPFWPPPSLPSLKHHIDVFGGFLGPQTGGRTLGLIRVDKKVEYASDGNSVFWMDVFSLISGGNECQLVGEAILEIPYRYYSR